MAGLSEKFSELTNCHIYLKTETLIMKSKQNAELKAM